MANETKQPEHTRGPWSYFHDSCVQCERGGTAEYIISGPPKGFHGQFSHEPDARLIAAAPALLAALREIETICTESAGDCRKRMGTRVGNALVTARVAIAKATGSFFLSTNS